MEKTAFFSLFDVSAIGQPTCLRKNMVVLHEGRKCRVLEGFGVPGPGLVRVGWGSGSGLSDMDCMESKTVEAEKVWWTGEVC